MLSYILVHFWFAVWFCMLLRTEGTQLRTNLLTDVVDRSHFLKVRERSVFYDKCEYEMVIISEIMFSIVVGTSFLNFHP